MYLITINNGYVPGSSGGCCWFGASESFGISLCSSSIGVCSGVSSIAVEVCSTSGFFVGSSVLFLDSVQVFGGSSGFPVQSSLVATDSMDKSIVCEPGETVYKVNTVFSLLSVPLLSSVAIEQYPSKKGQMFFHRLYSSAGQDDSKIHMDIFA